MSAQAWGAATRAGGAGVRESAFGVVFPVLSPARLQLGPCLISPTMASALEEVRVRLHLPTRPRGVSSAVARNSLPPPALGPVSRAEVPGGRLPGSLRCRRVPKLRLRRPPAAASAGFRRPASVAPGKLPMDTRRSAPALRAIRARGQGDPGCVAVPGCR